MKKARKTPPIVLMMADGFGLSTAWQSNVVASAKPDNFNNLWNDYHHLALRQEIDNRNNPNENFSLIATGQRFEAPSQKRLLSSDQSQQLLTIFDSLKRNNGSVHVVCTFSKDDKQSLERVRSVLKFARSNSILSVFIHLIIDNTFDDKPALLQAITNFESDYCEDGYGILATITGLNYFTPDNYQNILDVICRGKGAVSLTSRQIILKKKPINMSDLETTMIKSTSDSRVNDFDLLFICNAPNRDFVGFIKQLIIQSKMSGAKSSAKFLNFFAFDEFPIDSSDVHFIYRKDSKNYLSYVADKQGLSQALITDTENIDNLNLYYLGDKSLVDQKIVPATFDNTKKQFASSTEKIIDTAIHALKSEEYDFITIDLPTLPRFLTTAKFNDCTDEVKRVDKGIAAVAEEVMEQDGYFILCSPFGGSENMVENKQKLRDNNLGRNNFWILPFLIVSASTKWCSRYDLFHEILEARCNLSCVNEALKMIILDI